MSNILFLTNLSPFPGNSGGTINTRRVLDGLISKGHSITLCFLEVNENNENDIYKKEYNNKLKGFFVFNNSNNRRTIGNFIKSIFYNIPLIVFRNRNVELSEFILNLLLKETIDVIYCDHLEMFQYVPISFYKKTIFMDHNAEHMIWKRYSEQLNNIVLKIAVSLEAKRICKYEKMACDSARWVLAADDDVEILKKYSKENSQFVITNHLGNEELLLLPDIKKNTENLRILYVGTLTWTANINGINWFIREILPDVESRISNVQFDVVGKYTNIDAFEQRDNVHYHGFVDDLEPFYSDSVVFVCPLLFGSGTKIKLINALYRGIPVVTTSIGAESIELDDGKIGFIADEPQKFAQDIISLYENDNLWNLMSLAERRLARENLTWDKEIQKIDNLINQLE